MEPIDLACAGLRDSLLPDVSVGAVARAWWRHDHPEVGWVAVVALVVAADVTGSRTMSELFRTASRHPVAGPFVYAGWGLLTAHLLGFIPPKYDPIDVMWKRCHV